MNLYLLWANQRRGPHYPDCYDPIVMDMIWDFYHTHEIHDLEYDPIKENSLFILEKNHLSEFFCNNTHYLEEPIRNCNNKKIIVLYHYKSFSAHLGIDSLKTDRHVLIDKLNFQPKDIMYIVQLKSDIQVVKNVLGNDVVVTNFDKWLEELNRYLMRNVLVHKKNYLTKNPNVEEKLFSLFIRRYEDIRLEVMLEFVTQNLLPDFHYTFACRGGCNPDDLDVGRAIANYINNLPERYLDYQDKIRSWVQGIPYSVDSFETKIEAYDDLFTPKLSDYYNSSKINVVLETDFHQSSQTQSRFSILTEKTYKAMFYKKPFILIAQPNTLQVLRDCGYKTFGHVIDESYDLIETVPERLRAISNECLRIKNLGPFQLQSLLDSCQENIEHNYNLMLRESFRKIPDQFKIENFIKS